MVWLVSFLGHDGGVHPVAVFSEEAKARRFMEKADRGVVWECEQFVMDEEEIP